ncbi:MAG: hypothetical protein AAFQ53_13550 [Bacteroidota bacterium]
MTARYPRLLGLLVLLAFVGCDAATDDTTDPVADPVTTAEAAASIANAVALDSGGALDEAASFATSFSAGIDGDDVTTANASADNGCTFSLDFDEEAVRYDRAVDCTWETQNGLYAAGYSRAQTLQFLRDGSPVFFPSNADAATFEIVSGSGTRTRPRFSHTLTDIGGDLTVTGLNTDMVTVNGSLTRAALDVSTTEAGTRSLDHRIEFTFTDITGPTTSRQDWRDAASGTISGRYQATFTAIDGDTIAVDRTFTVTFGDDTLVIEIGGERFEADPMSGELM